MTAQSIDGDFTACDVAVLNKFFSQYRAEHGQGGTNTRQRNLHHLFKWLAVRYGHADLWVGEQFPRPARQDPQARQQWLRHVATVAAYREHLHPLMVVEQVRRPAQQQKPEGMSQAHQRLIRPTRRARPSAPPL